MTEPHEHDPGHADGHDEHPHVGKHVFIAVFFVLALLTAASYVIGNYGLQMGLSKQLTWLAMMGVSCAKAGLVICCFMHLWWEASWKWVLTVPTSLMAIFLVIMLVPDIACRKDHYSTERWNRAATDDPAQVDSVEDASESSSHDTH